MLTDECTKYCNRESDILRQRLQPLVVTIRLQFPGVLVTLPGLVKYTLKHDLPSCSPSTPSGNLDTPSGIIKFYYRNGGS
jgi:hypothetical protein